MIILTSGCRLLPKISVLKLPNVLLGTYVMPELLIVSLLDIILINDQIFIFFYRMVEGLNG